MREIIVSLSMAEMYTISEALQFWADNLHASQKAESSAEEQLKIDFALKMAGAVVQKFQQAGMKAQMEGYEL
jgi:hypothetical protein